MPTTEHLLLITGVLLNCVLIVINRFVRLLPNWLQIPLLHLGIGLIVAGMAMMKA